MPVKLDLHTHSILSHDGGISSKRLGLAFEKGIIDCVAITDHNEISAALELQRNFGDKVIVGEEIMTREGEIIGLFLTEIVPAGLSLTEAIAAIKKQAGIVYVPHPFARLRHGIGPEAVSKHLEDIDIIEAYNGRSLSNWGSKKKELPYFENWAKPLSVASDSHSYLGLGRAYLEVASIPTREDLLKLVSNAGLHSVRAPLREYFAPTINKLRKKLKLR